MANYKMKPGSKETDTPGGFNKKQTDTISKLNFSPKIGIGRKKQAQKTLDSINTYTKMNMRIMGYKSEMCSEAGLCDVGGQRKLSNEVRQMQRQKPRAEAILRGSKVGPKKSKKRKLGPGY